MQLNKVDLNLFLVFDAVYKERNLTRAAEVLCVTPSAVSQALSRLRGSFDDQLFVRSPEGMMPTPVAENIVGRVRDALSLLNLAVQERDCFTPYDSERRFRFSMNDLVESIFLPALSDAVFPLAPRMVIESYYTNRRELPKALSSGKLDLAVDIPEAADNTLCHCPVLKERYVCVVRKDHPLVQNSLTLEQYLDLEHINISHRLMGLSQTDMALNRLGYQRKVQLRVQHYLVALRIVKSTNLALTIPRLLAEWLDLQIIDLPFSMEEVELHLFWHKRADQDPANRWLRDRVIDLAKYNSEQPESLGYQT